MSDVKRWAIRDAGIATFYAISDFGTVSKGDPIVTLKSLKTSGVETTGETVYARGGRGNAKLVGFSSNREANISLQDALFDNDALSMITGNIPGTGTKEVEVTEVVTATASNVTDNILQVSKGVPLTDGTIAVYEYANSMKVGDNIAAGTIDSAGAGTNQDVDIDTGETLVEDEQYVVYYTVEVSNASTIKVTSDKFGGTFKLVIDLIVKDVVDSAEYAGQLVIPKAKFEDDFSLDLSMDGDPSVLDLNLEVLKSASNTDMWELVIYDEVDIV